MSAPATSLPRPDVAPPRVVMGQLAMLLPLGILIFAIGIAMGARGEDIKMLSLAIVTTAVGCIPVILDRGRPPEQRHLLISMFTLIYMVYLVVPIFTYYMPGDEPKVPPGMSWAILFPVDVTHTQVVALLGMLSLLLAYSLPFGGLVGKIVPAPKREWTTQQSLVVAAVWVSTGWLVYLTSLAGLVPREFGSGFLGVISFGTIYGIILLTFAYIKHRSMAMLVALCIIVPLTSGFNFFTGSKKLFLSAPAVVVLASMIMNGRLRARWFLIGVLGLTMLYPASQFYRDVLLNGNRRSALALILQPGEVVTSLSTFLSTRKPGEYFAEGLERTGLRLDGVGRASVIIRETPRSVPYQGGWSLANIFIAYIPRILWRDKPIITIGQWITDTYGSGAQSATGPTWIGEFWMNFGLPGVLVGMFAIGFLLRLAHEVFIRNSRTIPALLASVVILYKLATTIGGGVASSVNGVVFALGPIFFAHFVLGLLAGRAPAVPAELPPDVLPGEIGGGVRPG